MGLARRDLSADHGYPFDRGYRFDAADIVGWEFRFRIFNVSATDLVKTIGDGVLVNLEDKDFRVTFDVDFAPGTYRYAADWKFPGTGWKQLCTGEFLVIDPREKP